MGVRTLGGITVPHCKITQIISLSGLIFSVFLVSGALWAQDTGSTVSGTITDEKGLPVGGTQVTVRHLETGRTWSLLTGSEGVYIAPSLPLGSYVIEASAPGFKMALTGIYLKNPREVVLDLTLRPEENTMGDPAPTSSQAPSQRQRERGNSQPSRVTRETASRSSSAHRLPPPVEFPPVDRRSAASPPPELPVTGQAAPMTVQFGGFSVQLAAFREREPADELRVMLQDRGYDAYLAEPDISGSGHYYRVRVGPFGTREEVAEVVADMRKRLPKPLPDFWIVPADQ